MDCNLDDKFTRSVASATRDGKTVVHEELLFHLVNQTAKHHVDIKGSFWDDAAQKKTKFIGQ